MAAHHLVVVPHTHWDREWHETFEGFRQRLVPLLDGLLELLDRDPEFLHFTLDGQTIVVDDYLEVRPEARERIERLVAQGRLVVGPWYVLPDEWLVSGEALIRNLRLGLRRARSLGAAMPIGYVPDQFGHVGQLPQLFASFGFEAAVLWRGVGAGVDRTLFHWEAPDGTRLFTVYLPFGYGNAALLPLEPAALAERLGQARAALAPFSPIPSLLLMNGSDHRSPQPGLPAALREAVARLGDASFEIGTLPGYVARARREADGALPVHRGELRSGLRAALLPGCASSRMAQKRRDFRIDGLLTRYLEPLLVAQGRLGAAPDLGSLDHAWRRALENHPHDSICGCSTDAVHAEVETRLAAVETVVRAQLERTAVAVFARVDAPRDGYGPDAGAGLVVWNPNAPGRTLVDDELEADLPVRRGRVGAFHVRAARGARIPARAEVVDPGEVLLRWRLPASIVRSLLPGLGAEVGGGFVREATLRRRGRELELDFSVGTGLASFDPGPLHREVEALLDADAFDFVRVCARRLPRLRLRFADDLPGYGLRVYRLAAGPAGAEPPLESSSTPQGVEIANRHYRIAVDAQGRVTLECRASGERIEDALRIVSEGDRGDEYNFDPVPGGEIVERPASVRVELDAADEAEAGIVISAVYRVPRELARTRRTRSRARVPLPLRMRLRLHRDVDRIDCEIDLDHRARDQRLRLHVRAPFRARRLLVESAFEVAERPLTAEPADAASPRPAELPIGAGPQRSFASLDDGRRALTVANRGGGEVEAVSEADGRSALALTLLRAVGWLSRADLVLRPGHAGPGLPTPGAQVPGPHRLEFALRLHAAGEPGAIAEAHRFAWPPLARSIGSSAAGLRSPEGNASLQDGARLLALDDLELPVSALEPRPHGGCVARLYNPTSRPREARLRLPPGVSEVREIDLAGRELRTLPRDGETVRVALAPGRICSLLFAAP